MFLQPRVFTLTQDLPASHKDNYSPWDLKKGDTLYECVKHLYGCIDTREGIGLTKDPEGGYPGHQIPWYAVEQL